MPRWQASYIGDVPGTFYFILFYFNILNTATKIMTRSSLTGPTGQWAYHIHIPTPSPTTSTTRS